MTAIESLIVLCATIAAISLALAFLGLIVEAIMKRRSRPKKIRHDYKPSSKYARKQARKHQETAIGQAMLRAMEKEWRK